MPYHTDHVMHSLKTYILAALISISTPFSLAYSATCSDNSCCGSMGGVQYCDSSAGRLVCKNGAYSTCYCTRHAVMDLQKLSGCCLWQGGVLKIDPLGAVICRNGVYSEECSLQNPIETIATY